MGFDAAAAAELVARPLPPDGPSGPRRPIAVAAAAVLLVLAAAFELLSLVLFLLTGGAAEPDHLPLAGPVRVLLDHFVPVSLFRACVDGLALRAASAIWRGRAWGRAAGVAVSTWWSIAVLAFSIAFAFSLSEQMVGGMPSAFLGFFRGAAVVNGALWAAVLAAPAVLLTRRSSGPWFAAEPR